jgi:glycosyltransferase involved in cell wall biosynthesis
MRHTRRILVVEPEAVAAAIVTLLEDEEFRKTIGTNAREASGQFGADYMAQAYCAVYKP